MAPKMSPNSTAPSAPEARRAPELALPSAYFVAGLDFDDEWSVYHDEASTALADGSEHYEDPQNTPSGAGQQLMTHESAPNSEVPLTAEPAPPESSRQASPFPIDPVLLEEDASRFAFPLAASPTPADSAIASPARPKKRSAEYLDEEGEQTETSPATFGPSPKKPCLQAVGQQHGELDYAGGQNGPVEVTQPLHSMDAVSHHDEPHSNARTQVHSANEAPMDQQHDEQVQPTLQSYIPQAAAGPSSQDVVGPDTSEGREQLQAPRLSTSNEWQQSDAHIDPSNARAPLSASAVITAQQALLPTPVGVQSGTPTLQATAGPGLALPTLQQQVPHQANAVTTGQPAARRNRRIKTTNVPYDARPPMGHVITLKEIGTFAPKYIVLPKVAMRLQRNKVKAAMPATLHLEAIGQGANQALLKTHKNRVKKEFNQGGNLATDRTSWEVKFATALGPDNDLRADQWQFRDFHGHQNHPTTTKQPKDVWIDIPLTTFYAHIPRRDWPTGQDRGVMTRVFEFVEANQLTDATTADWNLLISRLPNEPAIHAVDPSKNLDEEAVAAFEART